MSGKHRAPDSTGTGAGKAFGAFGRLRSRTRFLIIGGAAIGLAAVVTTGGVVFASVNAQPDKVTVAEPPPRPSPRADRAVRPTPSPTPAKPSPTPSKSKTASPSPSKTKDADDEDTPVTDGKRCGASFYGVGQGTASGEDFDPDAMTAAHKTLEFGTKVKVTNTANDKTVIVRINDRGPFVSGRCLDLSEGAFTKIASRSTGEIDVEYKVL